MEVIDRLGVNSESAKWRISPLCERRPSPPHSQDPARVEINVKVSREADNCYVPRQGPAAFKRNQRETIWSLAVPSQLALWQLGPQQLRKLEQRDRSACELCEMSGRSAEPHRERWGTHKSSPRRKPTATLTASSSSLRPQDAINNANSQSALCRAVAAKTETS